MSVPNFQSLSELTAYIEGQDRRIEALEQANAELINEVKKRFVSREDLAHFVPPSTPRTGILSDHFLTRAFTIWGHSFVAQLIISTGLTILYLVIFVLLLGTVLPFSLH